MNDYQFLAINMVRVWLIDFFFPGKMLCTGHVNEPGVSVERCQKKCVVCEMLVRGQQWGSGFPERVDQRQECRMWNVVYAINCIRCKKMVYVGETGRTLKQRLKEHEADVRLRRDKPIADHFCGVGHSQDDMGVCVLERIQDGSRWNRKMKEQGWIQKCGTEWPDGLNTRTKIDNLLISKKDCSAV